MRATSITRPAPVRIYTDASELVGKPFRDLGEVSGDTMSRTVTFFERVTINSTDSATSIGCIRL
ncbi:Rcs stress response system protein RcsF, partial [Klebsiella pneumoniae]|uniref:Rcs stress response system protein RcsF n=1 Tax=Klebsiella pneumoniae TaxID=573 RepID=UPI0021B129F8